MSSTGSALEHPSAWWLKLERGDALLPKIDLCAPRTTRLFLSPVGLHQPARLLDSPRAPVSSFNPYSCTLEQVGSQTAGRHC